MWGGVIGAILLLIVYSLPTEEMKNNVQRSTEIYDYEGVYPQVISGYKMSQLDNCTDATMLLNAIFPGTEDVVSDAMKVNRIEYIDRNPAGSLTDFANDVENETYKTSYPRYWHGYLVILKPLLLLFDVGDIRVINMFFMFGILIYIIIYMKESKRNDYIPLFSVMILLMNPIVLPLSFQFSTVTYIMLLAILVVMKKENWENEEMMLLFLTVGVVTAYLDFFTFPLLGLYFPMLFLLMREESWKKALKIVILGSVMWIIGYLGMWMEKWLIGSILTGENLFQDAFDRVKLYEESRGVSADMDTFSLIMKNVTVLIKWPIVIGGMSFAFLLIRKLFKRNPEVKKWNFGWLIPTLLIALAPFVWYSVKGIHSYYHYWFTYREALISIFSLFLGMWKIGENVQRP